MQQLPSKNLSWLGFLFFLVAGVICGLLAAALVICIVLAYQLGETYAYASTRSTSVLNIASRDSPRFWFYIGAWGLGAVLLSYLSYRFMQVAKFVRRELNAVRKRNI